MTSARPPGRRTRNSSCTDDARAQRRRRFVRHHDDGASGQSDLGGNGGEPSAVRAADLHELVAHLHAGHADDEHVGIVAFQKHLGTI